MRTIKGFIELTNLIINEQSQDSGIGELSDISNTYSREKFIYNNDTIDDHRLVIFKTIDDDGTVYRNISQPEADKILNASKDVINSTRVNYRPNDISSINDIKSYLYSLNSSISDVTFYDFAQHQGLTYPVFFDMVIDNTYLVRLWTGDESFRVNYDEFDITVVPPVADIDDLMRTSNIVESMLQGVSQVDLFNKIISVRGSEPDTVLRIYNYPYVNPDGAGTETACYWGFIINGAAGDFEDLCQDALEDYIRINSSFPIEMWQVRFPSIFRRNEFVVIPLWDHIAIPDMLTLTGINSVIVDFDVMNRDYDKYCPFYSTGYTFNHKSFVPSEFDFLTLAIINGQYTEEPIRKFIDIYRDYIPVSSLSYEFERMSVKTQTLKNNLTKLLTASETYSFGKIVRDGIKVRRRLGNIYLSIKSDNHLILLVPKSEYVRL